MSISDPRHPLEKNYQLELESEWKKAPLPKKPIVNVIVTKQLSIMQLSIA